MTKSNRQKRIRRSKDEIISILADLHKSGLSRKEFAGSRGLSSSSVDNWFSQEKRLEDPRVFPSDSCGSSGYHPDRTS